MKLPDRDGEMVLVLVLVTPSQELESLFEVWTADTGACLRQHLRSLDRARAGEQPAGRLLNKLDWTEGVSSPDIMLYNLYLYLAPVVRRGMTSH